jgi:hypothetical protein
MKILYIARHGQKNNDDEGSIYKALTQLGHEVTLADENNNIKVYGDEYDFALFHKPSIELAKYICERWKGVCWFFDAINKGWGRNDIYAENIKDIVHLGFFTDGDFVNQSNQKNIKLLRQGLDYPNPKDIEVFKQYYEFTFIGTVGPGYEERQEYINKLCYDFYGWNPHTKYSVFKDTLTTVCKKSKIMLALPPVTDNYWSNRAYLIGGRGGFLIHPYAEELEKELGDSVAFFKNYNELKEKILYYLDNEEERKQMSEKCQSIIRSKHTYLHRCEKMIKEINEYR